MNRKELDEVCSLKEQMLNKKNEIINSKGNIFAYSKNLVTAF